MKYIPNIVSIVILCILSNYSIGQCGINFTTTNYNNYNVSCFGNCDGKIWVNPTGSAPFTYSWSTGQTWQNIDTLCSGTYTLTLTDNSGCTITETITLNEPSELVSSLIVSTPISTIGGCDGGLTASSIGGVPGYTLQWYDCANDLTGFTWDFTSNMCTGEWGAIFVDMNGCIDTTCINLEEPSVGLSMINTNIDLFNLNESQIHFNEKVQFISLVNSIGLNVVTKKINIDNTLNIDQLPTGIYFIQLFLKDDKVVCSKIYIK